MKIQYIVEIYIDVVYNSIVDEEIKWLPFPARYNTLTQSLLYIIPQIDPDTHNRISSSPSL